MFGILSLFSPYVKSEGDLSSWIICKTKFNIQDTLYMNFNVSLRVYWSLQEVLNTLSHTWTSFATWGKEWIRLRLLRLPWLVCRWGDAQQCWWSSAWSRESDSGRTPPRSHWTGSQAHQGRLGQIQWKLRIRESMYLPGQIEVFIE